MGGGAEGTQFSPQHQAKGSTEVVSAARVKWGLGCVRGAQNTRSRSFTPCMKEARSAWKDQPYYLIRSVLQHQVFALEFWPHALSIPTTARPTLYLLDLTWFLWRAISVYHIIGRYGLDDTFMEVPCQQPPESGESHPILFTTHFINM